MRHSMQVMDGYIATQLIRSMGFKGPIMGVTGNMLSEDKEVSAQTSRGTYCAPDANDDCGCAQMHDLWVCTDAWLVGVQRCMTWVCKDA